MIMASESSLVGRWVQTGEGVVADATCQRIERLVTGYLVELARSPDGWATLFRDPTDQRLWECTYPAGHLHGGGPPMLRVIAATDARATYGSDV